MYRKVVERGDVRTIFGNPHHPYTKGLLSSIPRLDERVERLEVIKGTVPSPYNLPTGCLFKRRCPYRMPVCEVARQLPGGGRGAPQPVLAHARRRAPDVGADASGEEAERAGELLTVEPR